METKQKKIRFCTLLWILLTFSIPGIYGQTQKKNDKVEIEKAIHSCIGWAAEKDTAMLYGVILKDPAFTEVHPNGRIVKGIEEFRKAETFWLDPRFVAVRYEIRNLDIHISDSGSVAWFCCILDDINLWDGEPSNWENTRWTGVLEKKNGKWRMMQQHFSFAEE